MARPHISMSERGAQAQPGATSLSPRSCMSHEVAASTAIQVAPDALYHSSSSLNSLSISWWLMSILNTELAIGRPIVVRAALYWLDSSIRSDPSREQKGTAALAQRADEFCLQLAQGSMALLKGGAGGDDQTSNGPCRHASHTAALLPPSARRPRGPTPTRHARRPQRG